MHILVVTSDNSEHEDITNEDSRHVTAQPEVDTCTETGKPVFELFAFRFTMLVIPAIRFMFINMNKAQSIVLISFILYDFLSSILYYVVRFYMKTPFFILCIIFVTYGFIVGYIAGCIGHALHIALF